MKKLDTTHAENVGSAKEKQLSYSTQKPAQWQRIIEWLQHKPLTTLQARNELDVMHPSARVQELKAKGFNIITRMVVEDSGKAKHKIGQYVLLQGAANE